MKPLTAIAGAVLLAYSIMNTNAQENPNSDPNAPLLKELAQQKSLLDAQKDLNNALAAKLKSEQELTKQREAPEEAAAAAAKTAQTEREADLAAAVTKLNELAAKLPSGTVTTASGLTTTPATAALALRATDEVATAAARAIAQAITAPAVEGAPAPTVVFVDRLPSPADTLPLQYWLESADKLEKKVKDLGLAIPELGAALPGGVKQTKSLIGAVTILSALPAVVSTVAGLFRSDYTEKAGELTLDASGFQAFVAAKLHASAGAPQIYPSLDAFAWSRLVSPSQLTVAVRLARLEAARIAVSEASSQVTGKVESLQTQLDTYRAGVSAATETVAGARMKMLEAEEKLAAAETGKEEPAKRLQALFAARLDEAEKALVKAKAEIDPAPLAASLNQLKGASRPLTTIQGELTDFVANTLGAGADGQLKVLTLCRQELIHQACYPSDFSDSSRFPPETRTVAERAPANRLFFVTLAVRQKPQSVIEKKSLWSHTYYATALLAVDYQVAQADGRLLAAEVKWQGYADRMPKPTELTALNPAR